MLSPTSATRAAACTALPEHPLSVSQVVLEGTFGTRELRAGSRSRGRASGASHAPFTLHCFIAFFAFT
jgi:hypothetical protein